MKHLFWILSSVGILGSAALQACFYPNGTDMNRLEKTQVYSPCGSRDEDSMCCAPWDTCRPDGLCASHFDGNIWRDGCTDKTWKSPKCIKLCDTGTGQYHAGDDVDLSTTTFTVTPCPDGSFCCANGTLAESCCASGRGLFIVNGDAERINPIYLQSSSSSALSRTASSSSTTSSPQSSTTTTVTSSSTASSSSSSSPSLTLSIPPGIPAITAASTSQASSADTKKSSTPVGAIVGGVIGGIALLVLIIGVVLLWRRRKPQYTNPPYQQHTGHELVGSAKPQGMSEAPSNYHGQELDGSNPIIPVDPSRIRHEAP